MKKVLLGLIMCFGIASVAQAASVRYFQKLKAEANAELGLKLSSGAVDGELQFNNATDDNITVLKSTGSEGVTLILPVSTGTAGQVMKVDDNGQLGWTTAVTEGGDVTFNHINATDIHVSSAQVDGLITADDVVAADAIVGNSVNVSSAEVSGSLTADDVTATDVVATQALVGNSVEASSGSFTNELSGGHIIATDNLDVTGGVTASSATVNGVANINGDLSIRRDDKLVLDSDDGSDTYIINNVLNDTVSFFKGGVEYMRFD